MLERIINLFKKVLKSYQNLLRKLRDWHDTHFKQTKLVISGVLIGLMALLLIGTRLVPSKSKYDDTPIGEAQNFGSTSDASIVLTSRQYNSKKHFLVMKFKVKADSGSSIDPSLVKLRAVTLVPQQATYTVTPLANDHFVVVLNNLKSGYKAIRVTAKYRQADVNNLQNEVNGENSSSENTTATEDQSKDAKIYVNESRKFINNQLTEKSQKEYAVESLNTSIKNLNKRLKKAKDLRHAYNNQITADQRTIHNLQVNSQYKADNSSTQDQINEKQTDITAQQSNLQDLDKKVAKLKKQRQLYYKQISDIESGTYKFEASSSTGRLK